MKNKILMAAYTIYISDARVIKESLAAYDENYNVDFICLRKDGEKPFENINGINVIRVNQTRYRGNKILLYLFSYLEFFIRGFLKISWLHLKNHYSIIHINNIPDFFVFMTLIPKLLGAKIILDIHDPMPNLFLEKMKESKLKNILYRLLIAQEVISSRYADATITVTEPVKIKLIEDGIRGDNITVVANFADENNFKLKENYFVDNKIRMIHHGTILKRNGLDVILKALAQTKNRDKYYLKIIGEGDYSEEIKSLIRQYNLELIVDFDNKSYPFFEVAKLIRNYDLGIVSLTPSRHADYALPTKMIEYILVGIPFIAICTEANRHYLKDKGCFYYDPNNINSVIDIFEKISDDNSLIYKKRDEVLQIRQKFMWSNEKKKYIYLLDRLLYNNSSPKINATFYFDEMTRKMFNRKMLLNVSPHYSIKHQIYYHYVRPFLPKYIRLFVHKINSYKINYNKNFIDETIVRRLKSVKNNENKFSKLYPGGFKSAIVLTHDVESYEGLRFIPEIIELENKYGYRSSWNIVPHKYKIDRGIIRMIKESGCEIGIHGYNHDGKLFSDEKTFNKRAPYINAALKEYGAVGFRAPMVHHNLVWLQKLDIKYDCSCFDYDPFQPFPDSLSFIWPVTVGKFIELPYTLPQDHTLFCVLGHKNIDLWKAKTDWLVKNNGIVLALTHPDYLRLNDYLKYYEELLEYFRSVDNTWHCLPCQLAAWWCVNEKKPSKTVSSRNEIS